MRILLANYRYFISGGPERYMFNATNALQRAGHEVVPFSIQYKQNLPTPYSKYFASPAGSSDEVYFYQQDKSLTTVAKTLERLFYSPEVKNKTLELARSVRPDVAYVLHYLRKLSPSLLVGLREAKVPIVVRLSDYQMSCPQAHLLREGKPCEMCVGGNLLPSIRFKCVQRSMPASAINAVATWFHRLNGYFDLIDSFVVTNNFMLDILKKSGVSNDRISYIPTFVQPRATHDQLILLKNDVIAYVGRLDYLKGVHVLIEAIGVLKKSFPNAAWRFKIAGDGSSDYVGKLHARVTELKISEYVEFCGELNMNGVFELLASSRIQVIPSLWYENLPNALLEGCASSTPAIVSNLGSLSGTIEDGKTGFLFKAGDADDLAKVLGECWKHKDKLNEVGHHARMMADDEFSEVVHINKLVNLFNAVSS